MGRVEDARREADEKAKALRCAVGQADRRLVFSAHESDCALAGGTELPTRVSSAELHRLVEWIDRWYPREAKPTEPTPDALREAFRRGAEAQRLALHNYFGLAGCRPEAAAVMDCPLVTEPAP